jgi:hypothetical protein
MYGLFINDKERWLKTLFLFNFKYGCSILQILRNRESAKHYERTTIILSNIGEGKQVLIFLRTFMLFAASKFSFFNHLRNLIYHFQFDNVLMKSSLLKIFSNCSKTVFFNTVSFVGIWLRVDLIYCVNCVVKFVFLSWWTVSSRNKGLLVH